MGANALPTGVLALDAGLSNVYLARRSSTAFGGLGGPGGLLATEPGQILAALRGLGVSGPQLGKLDAFLRDPAIGGHGRATRRVSAPARLAPLLAELGAKLRSGEIRGIAIDKHHRGVLAAVKRPPGGRAPGRPENAATAPSPPRPFAEFTAADRLKLLLTDTLPLLGPKLREAVEALLSKESVAQTIAALTVLAAAQAVPGAGEALDASLVGLAFVMVGWSGLKAIVHFARAIRGALDARSERVIASLAPGAAEALVTLGEDFVLMLVARGARRMHDSTLGAGGGGEGGAEGPLNEKITPAAPEADAAPEDAPPAAAAAPFTTKGLSTKDSLDYLKTDSGRDFLGKLRQADPDASPQVLQSRAIGLLQSGSSAPSSLVETEPLVKIVPAGAPVSPYSPYFTPLSELQEKAAGGAGLADQFGLPIASRADAYDIYAITPQGTPTTFVSRVAPTVEGDLTSSGGAMQHLVLDRSEWSAPQLIGHVGDTTPISLSETPTSPGEK